MKHIQTIAFLSFAVCCGLSPAEDQVEFNRDIRPILSENCFFCHGFDEANREADLRLDTFEGATNSDAIVPGDAEASELLRRLVSDDDSELMPPPETEKHLTKDQIELVRRWIHQGAEYQEHWAWQPLVRPEAPQTGADVIDGFLKSGWAENKATPVGKANPRERLRRLSYDLRGLPPTFEEVSQFESNPSNEAFFSFRDQWMSGIAYAEHQSVRWLDLVRWADTSGFVSDEPIASGAYRAWIIQAIRDNMPFDEFSIAQLAGDLMPDPTDGQLIASGYNRIVNTNCEAGAIEEEQLYKLKGEHVRALGTVWLGMTTGCAECHDHKFDPFSAKDYYSLGAFFDDLVEAGVYTPGDRREPLHYVHDNPGDSTRDRQLMKEISSLKNQIASKTLDGLEAWEKETLAKLKDNKSRSDFVWVPTQLPAPRVLAGSFEMTTANDRQGRETRAGTGQFNRHHAAEFMTGQLRASGQKTDAEKDAVFFDVWIDAENRPEMIGVQLSNGDYGRLGWQTSNYETYYWGDDTSGTLAKPQSWSDPKRVLRIGDLPTESGWVRLRVPFDQLLKAQYEHCGMAWLHTGGRVRWGDCGFEIRTDKQTALSLGETAIRKWWSEPYNRQIYQKRMAYVAVALRKDSGKRDALQTEIVADAYREHSQADLLDRLRELESELFVMRARAMPVLVSKQAAKRKTTRLLNRGDYQDKTGPIVSPSLPLFLASAPKEELDRLDLGKWMFNGGDMLVARVFVNRLWHQFYGRGISETLEDSGTQGDWPSHLSLLDWLACEFRDSGWDRNHMVRLLTSTDSYQMTSTPTEDLVERDPGNRWHARQSRFRLTAESIRDSALLAAGLLHETESVPQQSFFPYQPGVYWTRSDKVMYGSRHMKWETSADESQYFRSLYTFWKRQNIHPTMLALDAPTRQECTARRNITNTPGQALALLNDPIFVEAARALAMRICDLAEATDQSRLERAFAVALQRRPATDEQDILLELLNRQRERYAAEPEAARQLIAIGQTPAPQDDSAVEIAAWTVVTRAMLNLHEFLNRS